MKVLSLQGPPAPDQEEVPRSPGRLGSEFLWKSILCWQLQDMEMMTSFVDARLT